MMNKKILLTMAAVAGAFLISCTVKNPVVAAPAAHTYPTAGVIIDLDEKSDLVTFSTGSGLLYSFYGINDYAEGDIVAAIMDDNGTTDSVLDDKIASVRYAGWAGLFEEICDN
ncbi:hypothetical protein [Hominiventricola filiformis]|uniref:Uncharacterized protein n=1 Tax=Hominiventricola filiformis TaxID=2885352 RepID=A0AAE3A801_9FIRM|nr:hypothetical protein [Hominiventricola filiformis]MCC2124815.1 hypothetical protein [Hominiventricola filiformis]